MDNPLLDWSAIRMDLTRRRKALGLSQDDLAAQCSVSRVTVSRRESGESYPNAFELAVWCRAVGLRLDTSLLQHPKETDE